LPVQAKASVPAPTSRTCAKVQHSSKTQNYRNATESARMFHALYTLNKPTVAAVHGAVRGGGCGIIAACDIAIATRTATFRLSEVKIGIIPAMISPYVISAMGERQARRYMLSGEEFDAAEAWRTGLVHDIVEEPGLAYAGRRNARPAVYERTACRTNHQAVDSAKRPQPNRPRHRSPKPRR